MRRKSRHTRGFGANPIEPTCRCRKGVLLSGTCACACALHVPFPSSYGIGTKRCKLSPHTKSSSKYFSSTSAARTHANHAGESTMSSSMITAYAAACSLADHAVNQLSRRPSYRSPCTEMIRFSPRVHSKSRSNCALQRPSAPPPPSMWTTRSTRSDDSSPSL